MVTQTQGRIIGGNSIMHEEQSDTKKALLNSIFGVSSTVVATLLVGLYVQIGSASQEIIRLQEQVRNLQTNVNESKFVVADVKAMQVRFDIMEQRIKALEQYEQTKKN